MFGVAVLPQNSPAQPSSRRHRGSATPTEADRRLIASNLEIPLYVRDGVEAYLLGNPGMTFQTAVMSGFRALGIQIEDDDLIPERAMRNPRKREIAEGDTPKTLKQTSLRLPRYVRVRAEKYLLGCPEMRFRHLVMAGLRELGIRIDDGDLIAERQNVLASASTQRG